MNQFLIRVVLADDHPPLLLGIQHGLSTSPTIQVCGTATNSTDLVRLLEKGECDVLVTDYAMPGDYGDGITLFSYIGREFPAVKLVVLTMLDNPAVLGAVMGQGIRCIVSKSDAVSYLIPAIHAAVTGGSYLSPTIDKAMGAVDPHRRGLTSSTLLSKRELEVVRLYATGLTVGEIAQQMSRSSKTISTHKARAMEKLGIERDVDLVRYATDNGIIGSSQAIGANADAPSDSST
ncbi:response regulator transcription factor [Burkholderia multivorans]|nr:response regulator transcription factor [Burkholderia multivorans]